MSGYKLALLAIFGLPALFFGFKYTLLGVYRGLIKRRIPMGEEEGEAATGYAAIAFGIYSLVLAGLLVAAFVYVVLLAAT